MAWLFSKRQPKRQRSSTSGLETDSYRSPGLEMVAAELLTHARHSVLDLGASSTHNVELFSRLSQDVMVIGLFQSCVDREGRSAHRSRPFRFDESVLEVLPDEKAQFGAVLLWDLLHYFDTELFDRFAARLETCLEPGAAIYLLASNHAPVPYTPISFQVEPGRLRYGKLESCDLHYQVPEGESSADLRLVTRDVERRMARFRPQRFFQLRNGYQEFVFRKEGERSTASSSEEEEAPARETEKAPRATAPTDDPKTGSPAAGAPAAGAPAAGAPAAGAATSSQPAADSPAAGAPAAGVPAAETSSQDAPDTEPAPAEDAPTAPAEPGSHRGSKRSRRRKKRRRR